jgi:hypothetical protein
MLRRKEVPRLLGTDESCMVARVMNSDGVCRKTRQKDAQMSVEPAALTHRRKEAAFTSSP